MKEILGSDFLYRYWDAVSSGTNSADASSQDVSLPRAVLLLVHGLGGHTARWDFLASFFAGRGISSYANELRGFGCTPERPRGHVDSFRVYERDILALREIIAAEHPGKKIFILGESLGGLIVFNLSGRNPDAFAGQILISPAFKNGMKFPLSSYLTLAANIAFRPRKTIDVPFTAAMCTQDVDYRAVMDGNPDELRVASLKLLMSSLSEQRAAARLAAGLTVPPLFLIAGRDLLVDAPAARKMFKKLALADKTLIEYPDMLHALSIELDRERVFRDILFWLDGRI
jgi:alpha-beta hydrolase superfamily lysophospholipase